MVDNLESQAEEREVLASIYCDDENFSQLADGHVQYKFSNSLTQFVLDIRWPDDYPSSRPIDVTFNTFFNRQLSDESKVAGIALVQSEIDQLVGESMTFSVIEFVKDNADKFFADQISKLAVDVSERLAVTSASDESNNSHPKTQRQDKQTNLTKSQKRRMWNHGGINAENRARGWNWVDVVRHLSQTGPASQS